MRGEGGGGCFRTRGEELVIRPSPPVAAEPPTLTFVQLQLNIKRHLSSRELVYLQDYLVHWATIVGHRRGFLTFQRESIKNAGHKYEEQFEQIRNSKIPKKLCWKAKDFEQI